MHIEKRHTDEAMRAFVSKALEDIQSLPEIQQNIYIYMEMVEMLQKQKKSPQGGTISSQQDGSLAHCTSLATRVLAR